MAIGLVEIIDNQCNDDLAQVVCTKYSFEVHTTVCCVVVVMCARASVFPCRRARAECRKAQQDPCHRLIGHNVPNLCSSL